MNKTLLKVTLTANKPIKRVKGCNLMTFFHQINFPEYNRSVRLHKNPEEKDYYNLSNSLLIPFFLIMLIPLFKINYICNLEHYWALGVLFNFLSSFQWCSNVELIKQIKKVMRWYTSRRARYLYIYYIKNVVCYWQLRTNINTRLIKWEIYNEWQEIGEKSVTKRHQGQRADTW